MNVYPLWGSMKKKARTQSKITLQIFSVFYFIKYINTEMIMVFSCFLTATVSLTLECNIPLFIPHSNNWCFLCSCYYFTITMSLFKLRSATEHNGGGKYVACLAKLMFLICTDRSILNSTNNSKRAGMEMEFQLFQEVLFCRQIITTNSIQCLGIEVVCIELIWHHDMNPKCNRYELRRQKHIRCTRLKCEHQA